MRRTPLAGGLTVAVLATCVGGGGLATPAWGHCPKRLPAIARRAIAAAVPGATLRLSPGPVAGKQLTITAPRSWPGFASTVGGTGNSKRPTTAEVAELGWRGEMAAAYSASRLPAVTYFRVATPGRNVSALDSDWLHGPLRGRVGQPVYYGAMPRLDTLAAAQAIAQLASSLGVVRDAYAKLAMTTDASVVPLDARADVYGLEASIRVHRLAELRPHLIDIIAGLQTGLTGNRKAMIEGLAIDLADDHGQQAGIWINTRGGSGGGVSAPSLNMAISGTVDTTFPNLTGGPPTLGVANGGGGY